jgi:hypothetical protein
MATYLTIESIKTRCNNDVQKFTNLHKCQQEFKFSIRKAKTLSGMFSTIKSLMRIITKYGSGDFKYQQISKVAIEIQYQLWIARTYIFYQLLQYVVQICNKEIIFPYKKMVPLGNISECKLGIFGSINPTSDIDLGIQYSGMECEPAFVWWLVSLYEKMYLVFCQKSCLEFDIEVYADFVTMPAKTADIDLFYISTKRFGIIHFKKLLPYVGCSILRNAVIAQEELGRIGFDELLKYIEEFDFSLEIYIPDLSSFPDEKQIKIAWNESWWKTKAKNIIIDAKLFGYKYQRSQYKRLSRIAEIKFLQLKKTFINSNRLDPNFGANDLCRVISKIGRALCYREESYILAPTIVHVVRIIQENKQPTAKRMCEFPREARCTMGFYGYLMSIIEQQGYILRFYTTYCNSENNHYNQIKCYEKHKKYMDRYENGLSNISKNRKI